MSTTSPCSIFVGCVNFLTAGFSLFCATRVINTNDRTQMYPANP